MLYKRINIKIIINAFLKISFHTKRSYLRLIESTNIEYFLSTNNIKFKFNEQNEKPSSNNRHIVIDKKSIWKCLKYFSLIDWTKVKDSFDYFDFFVIDKKCFDNPLNKFLINFFIPKNNKVYVVENTNNIPNAIKLKSKIKISFVRKFFRNDFKTINLFTNFIINCNHSLNANIEYIDWYNTFLFLKKNNVVRIGDGELQLTYNTGPAYQKFDPQLKNEINDVIAYFSSRNKVAVDDMPVAFFSKNTINSNDIFHYWRIKIKSFKELNITKTYSSYIWRISPYYWYFKINDALENENILINGKSYKTLGNDLYKTTEGGEWLNFYNKTWKKFFVDFTLNKKVYFISAKSNSHFLNYDLFDTKTNIEQIYVPEYDSYNVRDEIVNTITKIMNTYKYNDVVFILAAGPLGKILCKIIDKKGYRFLDIGNFVNYYSFYNSFLPIDNIRTIHNRNIFLKLKNIINSNGN